MNHALRSLARALPRLGSVLRYFLPYLRPHLPRMLAALALGVVVALAEVLRPWPLQVVFDGVLVPRRQHHHDLLGRALEGWPPGAVIGAAAAAMLLVSLVGGIADFGQTVLLSGSGQRVVARIRRDLFRHLLRLPLGFHTARRQGDLLMRLTGDIVFLRELLLANLLDGVSAGLVLIGTFAVMLWLDPSLTLLSLAVAPPVAVAGGALAGRIRRAVRRSRDKEGALAGWAGEALGAVGVLQAFGAESRVSEQFERENRSSLRSGLKASRLEAVLARSLDLLSAAGVGVTLALGAWRVEGGHLSPGGLLVFLSYQRTLYKPIRQLARLAARSAKSAACGERIVEILETPPEIADRPGARPCPPLSGEIRFENVQVRYPRGDLALAGVTLHVPAGRTAVIRGHSGAGKTTLISLIPRLIDPTGGRVLIDGHDAREFTLESLRARVAMVFQESVLFGLSIRDNIALGAPEPGDGEVEEAARRGGVLDFARRLPQGLDTLVGERGALLSGGERQRVALARAALRASGVLVLDEPFAHLDESSRDRVLEALREVARGRTVLLVTHQDLPGLEADLEVVLSGGRVAACRDARAAACSAAAAASREWGGAPA